jgi:crossover junction endodeoxyribonuclease RuvC
VTERILALDPSLTATGYVLPDGRPGVIRVRSKGVQRLNHLRVVLTDTIASTRPTFAIVEGYSYGSHQGSHQLGEWGGVLRLALFDAGVPFVEAAPKVRATYATGKGNASKEAVLAEAVRRFNYQGNDNNEADALVLWCLAQDAAGTPAVVVPATHRRVLTSVEWPESFRAHLTTAT